MPAAKKSTPKKTALEEKRVRDLRKMAGKKHVKQTNPDGSTKNKKQLINGLMKI
jgi:hypothetical protein